MIQPLIHPLRVVFYEGEDRQSIDNERRAGLLGQLLDAGYPVDRKQDIDSMITREGESMVVVGAFQGSVPDFKSETLNLEDMEDKDILEALARLRSEKTETKPGAWIPWFPVIDYDRCTNCMQCLSFCLFGVYGVTADREIRVQNEDKCKTNCPACSRVCPEAAIIFPKYRNGPVNGDEVNEDNVEREKMKIDISALLGGNVYEALRSRSDQAKERFAKERDEERALLERKRCLEKMQKEMDIPPEVLMSLPSMDEIQHRAEEAKQAAEDALNWRSKGVDPNQRA